MQLEDEMGKDILYTKGLVIQTTLNRPMQEMAKKVLMKNIAEL